MRTIVSAVLTLTIALLGLTSCSNADRGPSAKVQETASPPTRVDEWATVPETIVQIKMPPGWTRTQRGEWGLLTSPDKRAVLAFVGFDRPNESTRKLGEVATVLSTSQIKWGNPKSITIGPDALPAQVADGTCHFPSGEGVLSYATVNPGVSMQLLVVYALDKDASQEYRKQAIATVASLRKKR